MRTLLVSTLMLALVAAPAVQAQQVTMVASVEQPAPRLAPISMSVTQVDTVAAVSSASMPAASHAVAVRDVSARNILAVIGGVVVVVALIAFLR
jgi:hypothetical protein